MTSWEDIRFWSQVVEDSRRTVLCSPEWESRIKTWLAVEGLDRAVDVQVSPAVPDDQVFVVDLNALEASTNQALIRSARSWFR